MKKIFLLFTIALLWFCVASIAQNTDSMRSVNAYRYLDEKAYDKALSLADTLMAKYPGYAGCVIFKATVLGAMGHGKAGSKLINKFMDKGELHPKGEVFSAAFYMERGDSKAQAKLYRYAISDYNKAYESVGNSTQLLKDVLMGRSRAEYAIHKYNSVHTDMEELLAKDSTDFSALTMMFNALNMLDNTDEIMIYLDRAMRLYPDSDIVYGNLAYRYQNAGDYKKAIELNNKALELGGDNLYHFNNRGFEKYKLNDLAGALADINRSIELGPYNSFAFKNRALVYIAMKENGKACADLHTAIELGFAQQYGDEVDDLIKSNCGGKQ